MNALDTLLDTVALVRAMVEEAGMELGGPHRLPSQDLYRLELTRRFPGWGVPETDDCGKTYYVPAKLKYAVDIAALDLRDLTPEELAERYGRAAVWDFERLIENTNEDSELWGGFRKTIGRDSWVRLDP